MWSISSLATCYITNIKNNYIHCFLTFQLFNNFAFMFLIRFSLKILLFRNQRQKIFEFLNRLCLLISSPLPPTSLTDSLHFSWSIDFILLLALYTIYTYLYMYCLACTYNILILCLYTDPTSYFTLALFPPLICMTVNYKISPALVFLESTRSGV